MSSWLIIGISGVSCCGKTTLASLLIEHFSSDETKQTLLFEQNVRIDKVAVIKQDDYFYPTDSPNHVWVKDLNHINREHLGALNMAKMCEDLQELVGLNYMPYNKSLFTSDLDKNCVPLNINILIIEGYLIFNHATVNDMCQLRICLKITFEKCLARRVVRVYPQPTPVGYFEQYVWPIYKKHYSEYKDMDNLLHLNGDSTKEECFARALKFIVDSI